MSRDPAIRYLPLLAPHENELEKCVYCPKLCRATCPVSNAEPDETLTPWGKMSTAYFMARGDVPIDEEAASVAWACASCFACRERCDHRNQVGPTLEAARADLFARGKAPEPARALASSWDARTAQRQATVDGLSSNESRDPARAEVMLVAGCSYLRRSPEIAALAGRVVETLLDKPTAFARGCCGYALTLAGDAEGADRERRALAREVAGKQVVVLDPGCFRAVETLVPRAPELLVDVAAARLDRLSKVPDLEPVRYHDPCQLGRGLGRYEQPRAILARVTGAPVRELERNRTQADCSGGGGLLPLTRPRDSETIAAARLAEHERLGGGPLVTACGDSLHRFQKSGADVRDLVTFIAAGLGLKA